MAKNNNNIAYKIAGFELSQFKTAWDKFNSAIEVNVNNNINFSYNAENRTLKCTNDIVFTQGSANILEIQFSVFVEIHPQSISEMTIENQIIFPSHFLAQCASFGHGAIRGVMFLKTTNTPFEGVILPPAEYHKIFKEPFVVDLNNKNTP